MTVKREAQVSLAATPFYHCYVRCVRKAYLCGEDYSTGQNYDHRKQWIVSRLRFLSYVYAIDICSYAIMSNHYHVVLHVDEARAAAWSKVEVAERWMQLYKGHVLVDKWLAAPESIDNAVMEKVDEIISEWRDRLSNISWFMRGINETIARMANAEEGCKGRFWESRFKSQALLDEAAVLSCMAYVDLNPIRAGMEKTLTESDYTSIQQRLFDYSSFKSNSQNKKPKENQKLSYIADKELAQRINDQRDIKDALDVSDQPEAPLMPFDGSSHTSIHTALPFTREDYFQLLDTTGRIIREDKRGFIPSEISPIIAQLGINPNKWIDHIKCFGQRYGGCAGSADNIVNFAGKFERSWAKGIRNSGKVYA
jgi:REP element-mobilizing transposase RayT